MDARLGAHPGREVNQECLDAVQIPTCEPDEFAVSTLVSIASLHVPLARTWHAHQGRLVPEHRCAMRCQSRAPT